MNERKILISQYHAALEMLKQTIIQCPEWLWKSLDTQTPFWQIAYHALFYTHLYVQDSQQTFTAWSKHREEYQLSEQMPQPSCEPPDKATVLEYLAFCEQQVVDNVVGTNLEADSGFDWLPFSKLELQLYTIRHIQQHVGELMERLGSRATIDIDWVGSRHG
jgi:hypothetical protein